jgi:hypothetical protein
MLPEVFGHKIFSGQASMWLVSIAAVAQARSILGSPSAQIAHPLAQAAQVLLSHLLSSTSTSQYIVA